MTTPATQIERLTRGIENELRANLPDGGCKQVCMNLIHQIKLIVYQMRKGDQV